MCSYPRLVLMWKILSISIYITKSAHLNAGKQESFFKPILLKFTLLFNLLRKENIQTQLEYTLLDLELEQYKIYLAASICSFLVLEL